MKEEVFRHNIKVGTAHHGKIGFEHCEEKDWLAITSFHDDEFDYVTVRFPFEAVPELLKLLLHAWTTKTRERDDDCFAFPRMGERT